MKSGKKNSFKEEIKNIFIFYALIPVILCGAVFLLILASLWHRSLSKAGIESCSAVAQGFESLVTSYREGMKYFSGRIDIDRFRSEPRYAAEISQEVFRFLGNQAVRGDFYLLGQDGSLLYSTAGKDVPTEQLRWSIIRRIDPEAGDPVLDMVRYSYGGETLAELQMGAPSRYGDRWRGYVLFTISSAGLGDKLIGPQRMPMIVTNRFHRIMLGETVGFDNGMGKLDPAVRRDRGYVGAEDGLYYISRSAVLGGLFYVYAIQESGGMLNTVLLISFLVVVIVASVTIAIYYSAHVVSVNKTRIVDEIVEAFKNAEGGDLHSHLHISSNDEFAAIGGYYNTMVDSLRSLIDRNKRQAQETVLSRIKQLESQFNPHFLFNSLESVRFMIRLDPHAADEMIVCLSRLLRYSIQNDSELVTLEEEMAYTQDYLQILSYRFGDRFRCSIDFPDALKETTVPPLLFQPILENAVKYGFEDRDQIHVQLKISTENGLLLIEISDNGAGMTAERLRQVRHDLLDAGTQVNHIGLYNIHQRICLIYGAQYGLQVHSEYGSGTSVRFHLPFGGGSH